MPERIVLASASAARARLLRAAGIAFTVDPATIDESTIKTAQRRHGAAALDCATALACAKGEPVSARHPGAYVIGADQLLVLGETWLDKPESRGAARRQLLELRGHTHTLATAACVCRNGKTLWHAGSGPSLTMREFTEPFLDDYLAAEGDAVLGSVGAYCLEGRGVQLFAAVTGDHFAIQGLPLVEVLACLRGFGAVAA